jgi:patatin-like phospholipase/acyl hydrolase
MNEAFKILSIDGGGFRGVYPAHILSRIEEEFSIKWSQDFDLLAGTSTGSIIAAALALGLPAKSIVDLYQKHGKDIFEKSVFRRWGLFSSKYKNNNLTKILNDLFDGAKLGDIEIPLILPATDIGNGGVHVFKSSYHNEFVRDKNVPVAEAVLASCSAPTYFPPTLAARDQYLLADGGLWANNPAFVAVIDAQKRLNVEKNLLKVLTIGTGIAKQFYPIKKFTNRWGLGWGFAGKWGHGKFIEMLLNLQSQNANNMLNLTLSKDQILRINFESDKKLPLDSTAEFKDLITKADYVFTHESARIQAFITNSK